MVRSLSFKGIIKIMIVYAACFRQRTFDGHILQRTFVWHANDGILENWNHELPIRIFYLFLKSVKNQQSEFDLSNHLNPQLIKNSPQQQLHSERAWDGFWQGRRGWRTMPGLVWLDSSSRPWRLHRGAPPVAHHLLSQPHPPLPLRTHVAQLQTISSILLINNQLKHNTERRQLTLPETQLKDKFLSPVLQAFLS